MKICILSMQKVQNLGSLLQGYSLKRILEEMGHDVRFIDIERIEEDDALLLSGKQNYSMEREPSGTVISKLKKIDKYFLNRIRIKYRSEKQDEEFNVFREKELNITSVDNNQIYEVCVIGSDEVFNCLNPAPWGFTSQLFGNVRQAKRVITYAASCGATSYDKLTEPVKRRIKEAFKNISSFSVRDNNTKEFVQLLSEKDCMIHMDPVVIGNFDAEIKDCNISSKVPEHYCIIYSYYNRIHTKKEIETIKAFCQKKNLELVTIGAPQMWVRNHLVLTPFEALAAFQKADFVITDTFHGTIFSAKYAERFATMARPSNRNKLLDLVTRLEIKEHLINSMDELDQVYHYRKNQNKMDGITLRHRKSTEEYLKKALIEPRMFEYDTKMMRGKR